MSTKRIDKLVSLLPHSNVLADVGCDHGYVGINALVGGKAKHVVFVDVSALSLNKARDNCPPSLLPSCTFLCRDGLGQLQTDCAVIAGMGGLEVISICSKASFPPPCLVLQPNRNAREVRAYLQTSYKIVSDEMMCENGKFYNMIVAERAVSPKQLTELELEFGKTNLLCPSEDFRLFLDKERAKLKKILCDCKDPDVEKRLSLVERALAVVGGKQ